MPKPTTCANCGREIHSNWTLCRSCAVAHVRGTEAYDAPCPSFVPDPLWPMIGSCAECGFAGDGHPGVGVAKLVVSF